MRELCILGLPTGRSVASGLQQQHVELEPAGRNITQHTQTVLSPLPHPMLGPLPLQHAGSEAILPERGCQAQSIYHPWLT